MHAAHSYVGVWDDHEVESSYYGLRGGNVQGRTRRVTFPQRRRNGYRAFFEYMPFRRFAEDPDRIYRSVNLGRACEIFLMDLHQYADPAPCPRIPTEGPIPLLPCGQRHDPDRTLLGGRQRQWLEAGLGGSRATWKLLGNSMMMMGFYYGPDLPFNLSQWDGWAAERHRVARFILDHGVENVAAFTGDIHTFFAGYVTTNGDVTGERAITEFIGSSVSSPGIPENLAKSIGVQSPYYPLLTERVNLLNPHIVYDEMRHRGYSLVEARHDELDVAFRAVRDATKPSSPRFTVKRFTVPAGELAIHES
jgi:alkaline phosphatase D